MQHSVILYRIEPARNMRRFYRLDIQSDLFGKPLCTAHVGTNREARPGAQHPLPYRWRGIVCT
jgi:predicted DNA-binding WGR domain protein